MPASIALPIRHAVARPRRSGLAAFGAWLSRHQGAIRTTQWLAVAAYLVLVTVPAFLPLPDRTARILDNLTLFAQFAFWGVWWPFVLLSMVVVGRTWCGMFCPEGALTEFASRWSLGRAVPRWLTWRGWPFVAFCLTTIYGQMVSVYQYPRAALLVLGGSTVAAIAVGLVYGRDKRVWCRYLCPVNGVFELLAKLAPVHFKVDPAAWAASPRPGPADRINCAPLVPIRTMRGAGTCHMCTRCSGYRGAVHLSSRSPNHEVVQVAGADANAWQTALILFGLMGVALGAFHWTTSPVFLVARQWLAELLVDHDVLWPLRGTAPWWVLTNYPGQNDVMTPLDGGVLLAYIGGTALLWGGLLAGCVAAATRSLGSWSSDRFHHLAQSFIPLAGCGVFLGLSAITVTMLRNEGLDVSAVGAVRAVLLGAATGWTMWLGWSVSGRYGSGAARLAATACLGAGSGIAAFGWALLFWIW